MASQSFPYSKGLAKGLGRELWTRIEEGGLWPADEARVTSGRRAVSRVEVQPKKNQKTPPQKSAPTLRTSNKVERERHRVS